MNRLGCVIAKLLTGLAIFLLISCGGGSGGDGGIVGTGLRGTAAIGAAIKNTVVFVKDKAGNRIQTTTDDNGKFAVNVSGLVPPYILKVTAQGDRNLYSYTLTDGVANLNPLSDLAARNVFKDGGLDIDVVFAAGDDVENLPTAQKTASVSASLLKLLALAYQNFSVRSDFDFNRSEFDPNSTGFDALLDSLKITYEGNRVTVELVDVGTGLTTRIVESVDVAFNFAQADSLAPTTPANLRTIPASATSVMVAWNSAVDNVGVAGYNIYRGSAKIATIASSVFQDIGLAESTEYCYAVEAVDGAGNVSGKTPVSCATTPATFAIVPPSSVTGVVALKSSSVSVNLTWNPAVDNSVLGYRVYRKVGESYVKISTVFTPGYVDLAVNTNSQTCYRIEAFGVTSTNVSAGTDVCAILAPTNELVDSVSPTTGASSKGATYSITQLVSLSCNDGSGSGCAKTYYTLNGADPTINSQVYGAAISISANTTLKFFSVDNKGNVETANEEHYVISVPINEPVDLAPPTTGASPKGANYTATQLVSLSCNDGSGCAKTYYTLNGANPTIDSQVYAGPISISASTTLKFFSVDNKGNVETANTEHYVISVPVDPSVPVAVAGSEQTVKTGALVTLNGSASRDGGGAPLTYKWTLASKPAGSTATLFDGNSAYPRLLADKDGIYELTLIVNNGKSDSLPLTAYVTAASTTANRAPIANAGLDESFDVVGTVQLASVASSDPDGDSLTYRWMLVKRPPGSQATISNPASASPEIVVDLGGNYVAALVASDGQTNSAVDFVTKTLVVKGAELEPNDSLAQAQTLDRLGSGNPILAYYEGNKTDDWYRFNAVKGMTYVVELFNVSANLNNDTNYGQACENVNRFGLYVLVQDSDAALVAKQCAPNGAGNGETQTQFTATFTGTHFIKVGHNYAATALKGAYQLRVLPKYTDSAAAWNEKFEPNNAAVNAYLLHVGAANTVTSSIDARSQSNYTLNGDVDWYRIEATAGVTYVVEVFNVSANLHDANHYGQACENVNRFGLYVMVQDADEHHVVKQCQPNGAGNVEVTTQFTATTSATYYIKVGHNYAATTLLGDYQIRVLPKHGSPAATWDAKQEPNNVAANAYLLPVGANSALTATIAPRSSSNYTVNADVDWYRIEATAGATYVVEVFNVSANLHDGNHYGQACENVNRFGLYVMVQDADEQNVVKQCQPNGAGNVEVTTQFTATTSATYYIKVGHNYAATTLVGDYQIRVLPKHGSPAATWDAKQEPNNVAANAYLLPVGANSALTATIAPRSSSNYTINADVDWYRIEATAGVTYVVEVYNVSANLHDANHYGQACENVSRFGLYVMVQDADEQNVVKQCQPNGAGNVEVTTQFTATTNATYYVKVGHNYAATTLVGDYQIRVLPKHDTPAATWDSKQEPNNTAANAFLLAVGAGNSITTEIEARSSSNYTVNADVDWYRFEATAGSAYVIELFGVSANLNSSSDYGSACDSTARFGLYLRLFDSRVLDLSKQCAANGAAPLQVILTYKATANGTYYILAGHNYAATSLYGAYSIRIIQQ